MKYLVILSLMVISSVVFAGENNKGEFSMFIENESRYGFAETVEKLSEVIQKNNWKVTYIHDFQETMKKNGKEVLAIKVIETCNPTHSYKILSVDDEKNASAMMPCRISVYEKADGKTYISRINAGLLAGQLGGITGEVMSAAFNEMEEMIKEVVR